MAHFTSSPFHKPSPFEFPQHLGTSDSPKVNHLPAHSLPTPASTSVIGGQDFHSGDYFETPTASVSATEGPGSRFRRAASSIVYHNSNLRESRERTVQRSSRSFLVVIPPASLSQQHGTLGHTLSSGPRHRLSQGLLMPLFPTMFAQLTAIAREFSFPSTTGLCLYVHYTEHGTTVTPRIADDSWQMIWAHALDPASANPQPGLPVCGKVEFDIDMRLARWYGAWLASSHREQVDVPMSVTPSAPPSIVHYREESGTTFGDGDDQESVAVTPARRSRHVPRKLSLVDRFDVMSNRSVTRSLHPRLSPPEQPPAQNLTPIQQEDEPQTAKYDLERRVKSWRASATVLPAVAAEVLLAGATLPVSPFNDSSIPAPAEEREEEEFRLEDYAFSVSSAGPGDYDPYSPLDWYYDPSLHMGQRAAGSVCLTPTTRTSFGPSDYTLSPYQEEFDRDLVYTPDIAQRMLEDVPPTPSVATSWGAPTRPTSPILLESYVPSVHLGDRQEFSRPVTPMTATSWGAPSRPTSPMFLRPYVPSVHLGDRQEFSRPVTPMTATSWGAPEYLPSGPPTPIRVTTPDAGQRSFDAHDHRAQPWNLIWPAVEGALPAVGAWGMVWPSHGLEQQPRETEPWNMVWPAHGIAQEQPRQAGAWNMVWPSHGLEQGRPREAGPWNMVWPSHGLDQEQQREAGPWNMVWPAHGLQHPAPEVPWSSVWPFHTHQDTVKPWSMVWPFHSVAFNTASLSTALPSNYPRFNLYPAVYPHFNLYPAVYEERVPQGRGYPHFDLYPAISSKPAAAPLAKPVTLELPTSYPAFKLYPAVYPDNLDEIYPVTTSAPTARERSRGPVKILPTLQYPDFNLYPVYPANLAAIYPVEQTQSASEISVAVAAVYPFFELYAAVYPYVAPYPGVAVEMEVATYPLLVAKSTGSSPAPIQVRLPAVYPNIEIYPALYPASMKEIYPVVGSTSSSEVSVSLSMSYPFFDIYPAAYPHIAPYPVAQLDAVTSKQRTGYPHFDLYPAVMPAYDAAAAAGAVTSALAAVVLTKAILDKPIPIMESTSVTGSGYPYFDLYPANYATAKSDGGFTVDLPSRYPCLVIYRPVYPALEIYPAVPKRRNAERGVDVVLAVAYPCFDIYPAVYPAFDIYRSIPHDCVSSSTRGVTIRLTAEYPAFEIYPDVYPALEIYPSVPKVCGSRSESRGISVRLTPSYPYFDLYPATYPYFSLWPTTIGEIAASVRADTVQPRERRQSRFTSADLASLIRHSRTPEKQNSAVDFRAKTPVIFEVEAPSVVIEAPIPVAEAPTLSTPRTHLDLHRLIFSDEVSTPSGTFRRPNKTHLELHNQVFSNDVQRTAQSPAEPRVDPTPSPSRIAAPTARLRVGSVMRASLPPSPRPVGARPRSPISRSPIGRTPPALPQPNLPLPLPPASSPLNTTSSIPIPRPHAFGARPSPRPMSVASPDGPRRSYSTSARSSAAPDSMLRNDGPPLSRSSSLMLPRKMSTIGRSPDAVDQVLPSPPRRRESLVAQRVRAFQNQEPIQPTILEDGLSDFPMPPRSVPQPMRRPIS